MVYEIYLLNTRTVFKFKSIYLIGSVYKIISKLLASYLVRKGSIGYADFKKAYHIVFVRNEEIGFKNVFRGALFVLVNFCPTDYIQTVNGLRQGDPLSPDSFF
ncbi:hypothetical protein CR513_07572, partial [Mucuna pruriens]